MLFNTKKSTVVIAMAVLAAVRFRCMQAFGDDDERGERGEQRSGSVVNVAKAWKVVC